MRTRSGERKPRPSPRRSSSRARIATRRASSTFKGAGSRSTTSRPTSPRTSNSKGPTRPGRNSGKGRGTSKDSCSAGKSDSEARCRRSWPSWARSAVSPSSRNRFRRSSSRRAERDHGDQKHTQFEDAEQEGGRHEQDRPGLRPDERDVVGAGDEKVAHDPVHEGGAHEDREEPGRERRVESQEDEHNDRPDQDDPEDEDEVETGGQNLEAEMGGRVDQAHDEMGQDETDEIPIETFHPSRPPRRKAFGPPRRHDLLQADRKSTRLNSSHLVISYAVFCLKKKK